MAAQPILPIENRVELEARLHRSDPVYAGKRPDAGRAGPSWDGRPNSAYGDLFADSGARFGSTRADSADVDSVEPESDWEPPSGSFVPVTGWTGESPNDDDDGGVLAAC